MRNQIGLALMFWLGLRPCGAADEVPALSHVREVNLDYAAKLPDFVADEVIHRYESHKASPPKWEPSDMIEAEIAVQAKGGFMRRNVRRNGQPWNKPFPGWNFGVPFGEGLTELFGPRCPNVIEFDSRQEWQGKTVQAYRFHSPSNGCFGYWATRAGILPLTRRYNPARRGRFLVDVPGNNLIRLEVEAVDFPKSFGNDTWTEASSWDSVKIGDESYLLPVAFETVIGSSSADLVGAVVEYKNHRHFEASADVTFKP